MINFDPSKLTPAGQANLKGLMDGKPVYEAFCQTAKEGGYEKNVELLMKILDDNKDTEYGRKLGFADIHSVEDFQKRVPISTYDDYAEYILRQTENGEKNLLCVYDVNHYNKTSGTMGNPKRIPMSDEAIKVFFKYNSNYMNGLLADKLGMDWIDGKNMSLTESAANINYLKNGASYGALSVKAVLQFRDFLTMLYTSPDEATFPQPDTNTRYLHARFGLMEENVVNAGASFSSFFLELLRYIEQNWEMLVNDIENGTIDDSIKMSDEVKASLNAKIKPMPERAEKLREIFSAGFDEPFAPKVWPKFKYWAGVGTASFKMYSDRIRESYTGPGIKQYKIGLSASEGIYSVPFELDCDDSALIPDSVFYEFLPLDAEDDFSKAITMKDVEIGKTYELIVTNLSGFYRYRMRDAVKITGKFGTIPTIVFQHRIDQTVSMCGEKTTEIALCYAAEKTAKDLGFDLIDFSLFTDLDARPMRYVYFMEIDKLPQGIKPKEIRFILEKNLAEANPSMGDKVKKGICAPTKLNVLEPETYMLYRELMQMRGVASGQLKPPHIISNEIQRKFFFGLTEYSVEITK